MSEQAPKNHEQHEAVTLDTTHEIEAHSVEAPEPSKAEIHKKLEQARAEAEQSASEKDPIKQLEAHEKASEAPQPTHVNRQLKSITLRRELQQIRRKESAPQRALSRIIHQPVIRAVSEATGKTISRPSGLLGGGLVALIGTSGYLYYAKHMGFQYNYFVFTALFVGGFAIGLVLELLVWLATSSRRHSNE
jgi:hypothetical protein